MKINKELLTKLSFIVGVISVFVMGLLFAVLGDLTLKAASYWLMIGILLTFGSGVCMVLGEMFREKPIVKWIMKGLALALAVSFIGLLIGLQSNLLELYKSKPSIRNSVAPVVITLIVLDVIISLVQAGNVTLCALQKDE